jgi:hypothetical protein
MLDLILSFLTFCGPDKRFCFLHELCDWCHDKGKVFNETSTKLNHNIKYLNYYGFVGIGIFTIA